MLAAGTHTPSVIFTPADTENYAPAQAAVSLVVEKAAPTITWPTPASIHEGTPIDNAQLNATASVPGTFVYEPATGETLPAGWHTLSATFTPMDAKNYTPTQITVSLEVTKTAPAAITWADPASISYGTPLSSAQLNARAVVPGTFIYIPDAGDVLPTGTHTLSVTFIPADLERSSPRTRQPRFWWIVRRTSIRRLLLPTMSRSRKTRLPITWITRTRAQL